MTTTGKTNLGSVLRYHREKAGLRREEVAARIGRSVQALRDYEGGKRAPSLALLGQLACLYGIEMTELAKAVDPSIALNALFAHAEAQRKTLAALQPRSSQ